MAQKSKLVFGSIKGLKTGFLYIPWYSSSRVSKLWPKKNQIWQALVFVNKLLLAHSHAHSLSLEIIYGCFYTLHWQSCCNSNSLTSKTWIICYLALYRNKFDKSYSSAFRLLWCYSYCTNVIYLEKLNIFWYGWRIVHRYKSDKASGVERSHKELHVFS